MLCCKHESVITVWTRTRAFFLKVETYHIIYYYYANCVEDKGKGQGRAVVTIVVELLETLLFRAWASSCRSEVIGSARRQLSSPSSCERGSYSPPARYPSVDIVTVYPHIPSQLYEKGGTAANGSTSVRVS